MASAATVRYTVEMTEPMKEIIDELAAEGKISAAEVLNRGLLLLNAVKVLQRQTGGGSAAVVKDGKVITTLTGV